MSQLLFHLVSPQEWREAQEKGVYRPASLEEEGFIHFSSARQIMGVHRKCYGERRDLLLLVVDETRLDSPLRWESPPGTEERFPHVYGPLNLDAVIKVIDLSTGNLEKELLKLSSPPSRLGKDVFGKFSLILGVFSTIAGGIVLTHTLISTIQHPEANPLEPLVYSLLTMLGAFLALLGSSLGLASFVQDERKGFASAGCLLNGLMFILLCLLATIASMAASA